MSQSIKLRENPRRSNQKDRLFLVEEFCKRLEKKMPDPKCELYYETPFQLLVSVVLSAQTTDKMVNRCMTEVYQNGFTPEDVVLMKDTGLLKIIRSIGLAPTKSKNVYKLSKLLLEQHDGEVPDDRESLEALPGVGRKTANVILGELFSHPTIAVDTHVYRVSKRLGLHKENTPEKCEKKLLELFNPKHLPKAHHWLILHGRYTCKAQKPQCSECVLLDICPSVDIK